MNSTRLAAVRKDGEEEMPDSCVRIYRVLSNVAYCICIVNFGQAAF